MKRLSVLIGMAQGILVLTVSAFAGEGTSLFALNKMSGPTEEVVGLSDNELARVEGSTVPRPPRTVYQSNRVEQRNSATGSQGDVVQENRLVQKNSVSSGSNQLNQSVESYILAAQAAVQRVLQQTFSLSSISPTLESGSATTITGNGGTHTVITVTNQGRTVTVAGGGQIPEQAVRNTQPVQAQAPSVPRIDQPNVQIPSLPPSPNIGGTINGIGQAFGGGARF